MKSAPIIAEGLFSYQIGGSERVGANLALAFKDRGYEVVCFALYGHEGPIRDELESRNVRCFDLNYTTRRWPTRRVLFQLEFWRFLQRQRIEALHLHHTTSLILAGLPARLSRVRRTIMTEHALHELKDLSGYRRTASRYCRFADEITLVAEEQVDYFRDEMGVPATKLHYVPNGVAMLTRNEADRARLRAECGIAPDQFMFLFAGRLHETKDLATMIRAVAQLPEELRGRARLVLAGAGPEEDSLRRLCAALNAEPFVHFIGPRRDVRQLMMAADAFVMSSRTEGLPMALLEAMATDLPCLATTVGAIPALFENGAGAAVPPSNPSALAAAMQCLATSSDYRQSIVERARERVRLRFSLDAAVTRYLELLGLPATWAHG